MLCDNLWEKHSNALVDEREIGKSLRSNQRTHARVVKQLNNQINKLKERITNLEALNSELARMNVELEAKVKNLQSGLNTTDDGSVF